MAVAAAILAGGRGTRMGGVAKAFLVVDGERIINRQLATLRARAGRIDEILIIADDVAAYAGLGVPVHADVIPGAGPLAGILTALERARADRVLVIACDMPHVTPAALDLLLPGADEDEDVDLVVPVVGGRPEPLFARYARTCIPAIRARLAAGKRSAAGLLDDVRARTIDEPALRAVDPSLRFLLNCNTPDDLSGA